MRKGNHLILHLYKTLVLDYTICLLHPVAAIVSPLRYSEGPQQAELTQAGSISVYFSNSLPPGCSDSQGMLLCLIV